MLTRKLELPIDRNLLVRFLAWHKLGWQILVRDWPAAGAGIDAPPIPTDQSRAPYAAPGTPDSYVGLEVRAHDVPESVVIAEPNKPTPLDADGLELLKLEYAHAAERYENIYKAIWLNFSYVAVLAAGILTFGVSRLPLEPLLWLAVTPVGFWLIATYVPLNFYGHSTRLRLQALEIQLNNLYFLPKGQNGLCHYNNFVTAEPPWHVSSVLKYTGYLLGVCWIVLSLGIVAHVLNTHVSLESLDKTMWQPPTPIGDRATSPGK